jgi:SAM-dependent methyltransferase
MTTYYYKNTITGLVSQNSDYSTPQAVTKAAADVGTGTEYIFQRVTVGTGAAVQAYKVAEDGSAMSSLNSAIVTNVGSSGAAKVSFYQPDRAAVAATLSGSPSQAGTFSFASSAALYGFQFTTTGTPLDNAATDNTATHAVVSGYGLFDVVRIRNNGMDLSSTGAQSSFTSLSGSISIQLLRECNVVLDPGEQLVVSDLIAPTGLSEPDSAIGISNVAAATAAEVEILVVGA